MPVRHVASHPYVTENLGRVALMRGPLLYCLEQADNPGVELRDVVLPSGADLAATFRPELLDGVVTLTGRAETVRPGAGWTSRLYRPESTAAEERGTRAVEITAIPYYAWANREPGRMRVWLPGEG
jgi:DUF1680 family protein